MYQNYPLMGIQARRQYIKLAVNQTISDFEFGQ